MTCFADYKDKFSHIRLEREEGVLELTVHRDGAQAVWDVEVGGMHDQLGQAFYHIGRDPETKVILITHAGDHLFEAMERPSEAFDAHFWDRMIREGKDQVLNLVDNGVPVVAALRGNAFIHAEIIALSDIIVVGDEARFADKAHTVIDVPPSDGVHVIWTELLGLNRARHFLLSGVEIDAREAQRIGLVAEIVPTDRVLERARAVARELSRKPSLTLRYARQALTQNLRRRLVDDLGHGLALEGLGVFALLRSSAQ